MALGTLCFIAAAALTASLADPLGALRATMLGVGCMGTAVFEWRTRRVDLAGHLLVGLLAAVALTSVAEHGTDTTMLPLFVLGAPFSMFTGSRRAGWVWVGLFLFLLGVAWVRSPAPTDGRTISVVLATVGAILGTAAVTWNFIEVTGEQARRLEATNHALEVEREAAHAASRAKSTFLTTMSHEIRTPLHAVLGLAELLGERPLPGEDRAAVLQIQRSGSHLLDLLNDVLDISRADANRLVARPHPTDPGALAREVVTMLQPRATPGTTLLLEAPTTPTFVHADASRIRQVLVNLVGNALKFTPSGTVTLRVTVSPTPDDTVAVSCAVEDTGIGIPADQHDQVFGAFHQVDSSRTRSFSGSGLGLAISRRLAELLGGELALVRSAPGKGSLFRFAFAAPRASPPVDDQPVEHFASATAPHVLVVEDDPVNRMVVQAQLSHLGVPHLAVEDGLQAVRQIDATIDLVLMDCQMPVMDGAEATRTLRQQGVRVPILGLSAEASSEARQMCLDAGMDDFLTKPVSRRTLAEALKRHHGGPPAAHSPATDLPG